MSNAICPKSFPEQAAQETLIALIQAGKTPQFNVGTGEAHAAKLIDIHKALTAYYRTLPEAQ